MPDAPSDLPPLDALPPLAVLRRTVAEGAAIAPVHAAMHVELTDVERGRVAARMPSAARDRPLDAVLVLADFALGLAVTGTLERGRRIATLRLGVTLLAPLEPGTDLVAEGRLEHRDETVGVSTATISDAAGRPVAHATGRNAVLTDGHGDTLGGDPPAWHARPSPFALLVPVGEGDAGSRRPDESVLVARPDPTTANSAGVVQGGVLAAVVARSLDRALGGVPQEMAATFVRAVPADGAVLIATARAEHRGRRLRSGHAELHDGDGRLIVSGSGLLYAG